MPIQKRDLGKFTYTPIQYSLLMSTVIIAGCGVFGLSTAFELAQQGHKVTALDKFSVPSPRSAANDLNKIIRTEYADIFYTKLAIEALNSWENDPLYKQNYTASGRITLSPSASQNQHRTKFELQGFENLRSLNVDVSGIVEINSGAKLGTEFPEFKDNKLGDVIASRFNPHAGFGHAAESLRSIYEECVKLGVVFRHGDAGEVKRIINGNSIEAANGDVLTADKVVLALGAATGSVVNLEGQVRALGLFVTHIKLTEEEYQEYKKIPIFFSSEIGYFFPPDKKKHLMKMALTFSDVYNLVNDPFGRSEEVRLPRYKDEYPNDTFPAIKGEAHVRKLLEKTLPKLANHSLFNSKICWISDTPTSDFLIDHVPNTENIYVATGDSGHGYKFLPNIGKYIAKRIYNTLDEEKAQRWKWKLDPNFPDNLKSRTERDHLNVKDITDWWIDTEI